MWDHLLLVLPRVKDGGGDHVAGWEGAQSALGHHAQEIQCVQCEHGPQALLDGLPGLQKEPVRRGNEKRKEEERVTAGFSTATMQQRTAQFNLPAAQAMAHGDLSTWAREDRKGGRAAWLGRPSSEMVRRTGGEQRERVRREDEEGEDERHEEGLRRTEQRGKGDPTHSPRGQKHAASVSGGEAQHANLCHEKGKNKPILLIYTGEKTPNKKTQSNREERTESNSQRVALHGFHHGRKRGQIWMRQRREGATVGLQRRKNRMGWR